MPRGALTDTVDVLVTGGGPAGAALGIRLAQLGRSAAIVEKDRSSNRHAVQSLTLGILPLLDVLGLRCKVEADGCLFPQPATIWWCGGWKESSSDVGGGRLVDRPTFDSLLLDGARKAGVRVIQPARVIDRRLDGVWTVRLDTGDVFYAQYLVDASGRCPAVGGVKIPYGARTLAMHACWSGAGPSSAGIFVEAGESQWYWGAPAFDNKFHAFVFTDAETARKRPYPMLIRESRLLSSRLTGASAGAVRVCDATALLDQAPVTPHSIKIGDAAITIDPLSSQGVLAAIGTALHAAVTINTMIDRRQDTELAMSFYRKRLEDSAKFHSQAAGRFYREQFEANGNEFWRKRATVDQFPPRICHPAIRPETPIRVSKQLTFVQVGAVCGPYVVREDAVELGGKVSVYFGGAKVADLLRPLDRSLTAAEVLRSWCLVMPLSQGLRTLEWGCAEGLIEAGM